MIGNYMKPVSRPVNLSSYSSFAKLPVEKSNTAQRQLHRHKMMVMIINRATYRQMRQSLQIIRLNTRNREQALIKIAVFSQQNISSTVFLAFQRIKAASMRNKNIKKILNNTFNLLQRIERYKFKQCFNRLVLYYSRNNVNLIRNHFAKRTSLFHHKMQNLVKHHKKEVFASIKAFARFAKSYRKVRVISLIHSRLQKQLKQQFFAKMTRIMLTTHRKKSRLAETEDLQAKLQDMSMQLQNKKESINRLEEELTQFKADQSNILSMHNEYSADYSRQQNVKKKCNTQKRFNLNNESLSIRSFNNSGDSNLHDMSFGSILGNLNKSRVGSMSKYDPNSDCACGYKPQCKKYKTVNETLKNQLSIVKQQLQMAKDLNQHFTDEINNYLTQGNPEGDLSQLKLQHQSLMQQRDQLIEKVLKYQKHISNLKSQFKLKMEQLYRKVRKNT